MTEKYPHFARWPSRPHTRAISLSPATFIPLVILTIAATVLVQQACSQTADEMPGAGSEWYFSVPTADDLMDSLCRIQELQPGGCLKNLMECGPRTIQLYQRALEQYLQELPRVHSSGRQWRHWWDDFNRQQECFWSIWRAKLDSLFEQRLETIWANAYSHRLEKTIPLTGSPSIVLTHEFGNVVIHGSPKPVARLVAEIRVIATSQADAEDFAGAMDLAALPTGSTLNVTTHLPPSPPKTVKATSIALQAEFPQECPLEVENTFGDLSIQDFNKGIKARTGHGTLEIVRCAGDLELRNRQGEVIVKEGDGDLHVETSFDPITAAHIQGDVLASNRFGPVSISQVSGAVQVENSAALVEITDVGGHVTVRNRLGLVAVQGVAGNLKVDNAGSPVRIADVQGETNVENSRGEIRAERLAGDVLIRSQNGDVYLVLDDIRQNLYRLDSSFGVIRVNLPPQPSALIAAEALYGTIDSDFPLEIKREGASQLARGKLGQGKANIQLDGRNTNIYLISSER